MPAWYQAQERSNSQFHWVPRPGAATHAALCLANPYKLLLLTGTCSCRILNSCDRSPSLMTNCSRSVKACCSKMWHKQWQLLPYLCSSNGSHSMPLYLSTSSCLLALLCTDRLRTAVVILAIPSVKELYILSQITAKQHTSSYNAFISILACLLASE